MNRLTACILGLVLFLFAGAISAEALDINAATAEQFAQTMKGVGKAKAEAIIKDREKNGSFKSVDDLDRVKGIGPATINKNRDKLTVGTNPPAAGAIPVPAAPAPVSPPARAK